MAELILFGQTHSLHSIDGREEDLNRAINLIEQLANTLNFPSQPTRDRSYVLLLLSLAQQYNTLLEQEQNFLSQRLQMEKLCDRIENSLAKSREYL